MDFKVLFEIPDEAQKIGSAWPVQEQRLKEIMEQLEIAKHALLQIEGGRPGVIVSRQALYEVKKLQR